MPPATGTSTFDSVTIPDTLLVRMSVITCAAILALGVAYFVMVYGSLKGNFGILDIGSFFTRK